MNKLYFFTATVLNWIRVLKDDKLKDIIVNSLKFLIKGKRIRLFAFVIMPNHIHLIWQITEFHKLGDVQRDFLKFTAHQIKKSLKKENPALLEQLRVEAADRSYQIWERNPLSIELVSDGVIKQKFDYIHLNPVREKWKLCSSAHEYKYSSARYYYDGTDEFKLFNDYI
ncbi:MAG TPA: transposase [Ignavibacteria bacterium]|jgi:REP element-mobilizing transposase RayT